MSAKLYNCLKCVAYCCTYAHIPVKDRDLARLAKHHGVSEDVAEKRFTKKGDSVNPRVLRHTTDEHFGSSCMLLDKEKRTCTIYTARPAICREFPVQKRCGYYEFLKFERENQDDPAWVATTN